jgi:DNA mismatch repair ATPase MutS
MFLAKDTKTPREFVKALEDICDVEKLQRKLSLGVLHPYEFVGLVVAYEKIKYLSYMWRNSGSEVLQKSSLSDSCHALLEEFETRCSATFDLKRMQNYNLNESVASVGNFFKPGAVVEVDEIHESICNIEKVVEELRKKYDNIINPNPNQGDWVKTGYNDQDGYFFTCTKIRLQLLQKGLDSSEYATLKIKTNTNACKISSNELFKQSTQLHPIQPANLATSWISVLMIAVYIFLHHLLIQTMYNLVKLNSARIKHEFTAL